MEIDISLYDFSTAHSCHVKQICVEGTECLYIVTCICFKSVQGYLFESHFQAKMICMETWLKTKFCLGWKKVVLVIQLLSFVVEL